MVKSPLHHIATALLLPFATATLPGPASALPVGGGLDHHYDPYVPAVAVTRPFTGGFLPVLLHGDDPDSPAAGTDLGSSPLRSLSLRPQVTGSGTGLSCELRF
ncbi:hypothetical protein [Geomonas oryzae]|uniref:hypothetical protein n=1 Tax=Geomonas oryzae TaxID=2364273 RepID=UPI00100B154A|nr:hypothetical protein [Geomonas oryzae]